MCELCKPGGFWICPTCHQLFVSNKEAERSSQSIYGCDLNTLIKTKLTNNTNRNIKYNWREDKDSAFPGKDGPDGGFWYRGMFGQLRYMTPEERFIAAHL